MRKILLSALASLLISPALYAAPPLTPGQIVIAGYTYYQSPAGACSERICTVDSALTTVTPISATLPAAAGTVVDLAIESPLSIVVLTEVYGPGEDFQDRFGTVLQIDVTTGAVTTLASGFVMWPDASIAATPGGRIFVTGVNGIFEIDRTSGAVSVLVPGFFAGIDTEIARTSLVTAQTCEEFSCIPEFKRIDLATGAVTPLGLSNDFVTEIDVRPTGDLLVFTRPSIDLDGLTYIWAGSGNYTWLAAGETWQGLTKGIASELDGNVLIAADGTVDPCCGFDELELTRFSGTGFYQILGTLDADVGFSAIDVTPVFTRCSNGVDDDGDGAIDFPNDPGCHLPLSMKEAPLCDDGVDNDGDGTIDWDGAGVGPPDPKCQGIAWRDRESSSGCGIGAELALVVALLRRRLRGCPRAGEEEHA